MRCLPLCLQEISCKDILHENFRHFLTDDFQFSQIAVIQGTVRGSAPSPRQGHCPWTQYRKLQSGKPNNMPMML